MLNAHSSPTYSQLALEEHENLTFYKICQFTATQKEASARLKKEVLINKANLNSAYRTAKLNCEFCDQVFKRHCNYLKHLKSISHKIIMKTVDPKNNLTKPPFDLIDLSKKIFKFEKCKSSKKKTHRKKYKKNRKKRIYKKKETAITSSPRVDSVPKTEQYLAPAVLEQFQSNDFYGYYTRPDYKKFKVSDGLWIWTG
jgi:hypothetical protein